MDVHLESERTAALGYLLGLLDGTIALGLHAMSVEMEDWLRLKKACDRYNEANRKYLAARLGELK